MDNRRDLSVPVINVLERCLASHQLPLREMGAEKFLVSKESPDDIHGAFALGKEFNIKELAKDMRVEEDVVEALICAEIETSVVILRRWRRGVEDVAIRWVNLSSDEIGLTAYNSG